MKTQTWVLPFYSDEAHPVIAPSLVRLDVGTQQSSVSREGDLSEGGGGRGGEDEDVKVTGR